MTDPNQFDLASLFQSAATALEANRDDLNAADGPNGNHGDNMVQNFQLITDALAEKSDAPPADQLAYASQVLGSQTTSGSGQMYALNLGKAAEQIAGQALTSQNVISVIGTILGASPGSIAANQPATDTQPDIGSILGGLLGGASAGAVPQSDAPQGTMPHSAVPEGSTPAAGDLGGLLGGLLSSLTGGGQHTTVTTSSSSSGTNAPGVDINDILAMGAGYLTAKNQGRSDIEAIGQAIMNGSNQTGYRQQSGQIVLDALLKGVGGMLSGAK